MRPRLPLLLHNIPAPLRKRPQWVVWRFAQRDGKLTKLPFDARNGNPADSTDPGTWSSFDDAVAAWEADDTLDGIGYVFAADDEYCGIDLDDALDREMGVLKPWAQDLVDRLNSYCEISPSGCGVKLFGIATKPGERCRKAYEDGEVEIYDHDRFFTVTGDRLDGTPADIRACQAELTAIYEQVFGPVVVTPAVPAPATKAARQGASYLTDEQILQKASGSRKSGTAFTSLWAGQWEGRYVSQSEADSALVFRLAFYTKDSTQLDRLFRRSGLMRPKWDERHGAKPYGRMTIDNALAEVTEQWRPRADEGLRPRALAASAGEAWHPAHLSQQVNAERLVQVVDGNARYNVSRGQWLWYDGRRFVDDHVGHIARAAKSVARDTWRFVSDGLSGIDPRTAFRHAVESEKAAGVAAMMSLAQTEAGVPVLASEFDANPYLFNCRNGTVDLCTGQLRPHDRADLLTKVAPVEFQPAAPRPLFDAFLDRITAGNRKLADYLARLLGRCLSGDITEQEIYFFLGEGANGKSVLIDTVLGILGDYAGTAPEGLLTVQTHDGHPTEIADLCGKRLVVASETEEGARLKVQLIKRLTGDGRLKARFMRQDFFEFDRTHKLIIVSNNKPLIRETKHAIWRRIRLVPFAVTIPEAERDTRLTERLWDEWPGILGWLVNGYRDWREGGMRTPAEVLVATQAYQSEQDPLGEYVADRCILGTEHVRLGRNDLLADYLSWCQQTGEKHPLGRNALFDHVRVFPGVREDQWRMTGVPSPVRGFRGIALAYSTGVGTAGVADLEGT